MNTTSIYADVPRDLLALLPRIRFHTLTPEGRQSAISDLKTYITQTGVIKPRTPHSPAARKAVALPSTIPQEAIDLINSYDYTSVRTWQVRLAIPVMEAQLRQRGLL